MSINPSFFRGTLKNYEVPFVFSVRLRFFNVKTRQNARPKEEVSLMVFWSNLRTGNVWWGEPLKQKFVWLVGWLVGWLFVCLFGWLVGWLFGWLVGWLFGWLVGCLFVCLFGWLFVCLFVWLVGWLVVWLVGWLVVWLVGCLFVCLFVCLFFKENSAKVEIMG